MTNIDEQQFYNWFNQLQKWSKCMKNVWKIAFSVAVSKMLQFIIKQINFGSFVHI